VAGFELVLPRGSDVGIGVDFSHRWEPVQKICRVVENAKDFLGKCLMGNQAGGFRGRNQASAQLETARLGEAFEDGGENEEDFIGFCGVLRGTFDGVRGFE
jgi:hypothetical protein